MRGSARAHRAVNECGCDRAKRDEGSVVVVVWWNDLLVRGCGAAAETTALTRGSGPGGSEDSSAVSCTPFRACLARPSCFRPCRGFSPSCPGRADGRRQSDASNRPRAPEPGYRVCAASWRKYQVYTLVEWKCSWDSPQRQTLQSYEARGGLGAGRERLLERLGQVPISRV